MERMILWMSQKKQSNGLKSKDATSEEIEEVIKELVKETSEKGKKYSLEELLKECMDENKPRRINSRYARGRNHLTVHP